LLAAGTILWQLDIAEPSPPQRGLCLSLETHMRLRLSNPALVPELLEFLESRVDLVAKRVSENELELSLLGSYHHEEERMTVELLVRAWESAHDPRASVEFAD
jgi:hypothetical protein